MQVNTHARMHARTHAHTHARTHARTHAHTHTHTHTHMHIHTTCRHTHTHAVARKRSQSFCQKCRWWLQLNTHTPYLCDFEWSDTVTWCMVEWCTQNLRRNGSISHGTSRATTTERYQYTTSMDINNTCYKRIQSLIQNHMWHAHWVCSRAENITI